MSVLPPDVHVQEPSLWQRVHTWQKVVLIGLMLALLSVLGWGATVLFGCCDDDAETQTQTQNGQALEGALATHYVGHQQSTYELVFVALMWIISAIVSFLTFVYRSMKTAKEWVKEKLQQESSD